MKKMNADKPQLWKKDIAQSVDFYNSWFLDFAPQTYRDTRKDTVDRVEDAFQKTQNMAGMTADCLIADPSSLAILRMATAPPIARDRLAGLSYIPKSLVKAMEVDCRIPPKMKKDVLAEHLARVIAVFDKIADRDILTWLDSDQAPAEEDRYRAATIIADRLCGSLADPIVRNAQEQRQLATLQKWLEKRGYSQSEVRNAQEMKPGTYAFRMNVPVNLKDSDKHVNIPVDAAIMPKDAKKGSMPILLEAKSAGDFTNTNKRRKEEAVKISQLQNTYGEDVVFILLLCGYFDSGYLGYEAAEGIDWVWEHRLDDMEQLAL